MENALEANQPLMELRGVTKVHHRGRGEVHSLRGVDLRLEAGEFLMIMGPSGSGKSTLLHLLGGLDTATAGHVLFRGTELRTLSDQARSVLRRESMGFVFQLFNLLPTLTAVENVALPALLAGRPRRLALGAARDSLERLGLSERAGHFPDALSGGEMQRVAIARALVNEPALVLCDEPTGSLDSAAGIQILELLQSLVEVGRRSVVMVTHDTQARRYGDRLVLIRDGLIESEERLRGRHACALSHD
jgi:putative ABC transport system ATP-binding protein